MKSLIALVFAVSVSFYAGEASASAGNKICPFAKARNAVTKSVNQLKSRTYAALGMGSKVKSSKTGKRTI
jgi:hypothetical protein